MTMPALLFRTFTLFGHGVMGAVLLPVLVVSFCVVCAAALCLLIVEHIPGIRWKPMPEQIPLSRRRHPGGYN
jgi:hypothetical protein